jgi:hypothetical protein
MDARTLDLINLELDGRLDAAGRAELEAALANDPAARTRREQLRAVARKLADAPAPALPLDFRDSVLRRLPQRVDQRLRARKFWRGGLALAASVVAAVVVLRVVQHGPALSPDQLGATLAPATATVTPTPRPGGLSLNFALPQAPADLVIDLPGEGPLTASGERGAAPIVEGRRIVVVAAGGSFAVHVSGDVDGFSANLVRGEAVTPVTVRAP